MFDEPAILSSMHHGRTNPLSDSQVAALRHVRDAATANRVTALARIAAVLGEEGIDAPAPGVARADLGGVVVNFHPDRVAPNGRMVVEALRDDGRYRNQFETRISNGGLTAYPGGDRDDWERRLFGAAYHATAVAGDERPKYGGLNVMGFPDGPCPRFGSCLLVLEPVVLERTTICHGDSHLAPQDVAVAEASEVVVAGLLERCARTGFAFGQPMSPAELAEALVRPIGERWPRREQGRALDEYVEAQIHGPLRLREDATDLVIDPSFAGTEVGRLLEDVAARYSLTLSMHDGFQLDARDVPDGFRGPAVRRIAALVARRFSDGSSIDAEVIGRAARSVVRSPEEWASWASPPETLQHLKQLWHVLVAYGRPQPSRSSR